MGNVNAQLKEWKDLPGCLVDGVPTLKCFEVIVSNLLFISTTIVILLLFIMLVFGSLQYLTSGGTEEKVANAKNTFKYALLGTVLFAGSYLILNIIDILFLGGNGILFNFSIP